jgi:hypothetical protein
MTFQAIIYADSPLLVDVLDKLGKHKLVYVTEETTRPRFDIHWEPTGEMADAIHIRVTGKQEKKARVTKPKAPTTGYASEKLPSGQYLWTTPRGEQLHASFPHEENRWARIKREANARADYHLTAFSGSHRAVQRTENGDYRPYLKGAIFIEKTEGDEL